MNNTHTLSPSAQTLIEDALAATRLPLLAIQCLKDALAEGHNFRAGDAAQRYTAEDMDAFRAAIAPLRSRTA